MQQWLKGWTNKKRLKIVIPHTSIDANLTHFPHLIHLSRGCGVNHFNAKPVFDELGTDSLKIAVTKDDGIKQLYVEVDTWDITNMVIKLWVSRSKWVINSSADTVIYLYYDKSHADNSAYVGVTGSAPAELVWNTNYKLVCHMNDNPDNSHVMDSTSNDNDGTKKAANEPIEAAGKIGKAQDFSTDTIHLPDFNLANDFSFSFIINPDTLANYMGIIGYEVTNGLVIFIHSDGKLGVSVYGVNNYFFGVSYRITTGNYWYVTIAISGTDAKLYLQGIYKETIVIAHPTVFTTLYIGGHVFTPFDGIIDEIQILNDTIISSAWVGASYQTQRDNLNFLSLEIREATIQGAPVPTPPLKRTFLLKVRDWLASKQ